MAGTAAGVFALGPLVGSKMAPAPVGEHAEEGGHGEKKGGGGHGGGGEEAPSYFTLDNLVVNPAGTQGTRFLVATLAIRVSEKGSNEELQAHDPEIRDALLNLLSARTVDQLSNGSIRDSLKVELKNTIESVIGAGKIASLLLPQFVLQ